MNDQTEKLSALYKRLAGSEEGKHLIEWIRTTITQTRQSAGRLDPVHAWGELKFADGLAAVIQHIETVKNLEGISRTSKR